jgi:hypothetical protein
MVVLDAGQVPKQPPDRVRFRVKTHADVIRLQAIDHSVHDVTDPPERIVQHISARHGTARWVMPS